MRPPRIIVPPDMDGLYHVVSRVVDWRMIFWEAEKTRFLELRWRMPIFRDRVGEGDQLMALAPRRLVRLARVRGEPQ